MEKSRRLAALFLAALSFPLVALGQDEPDQNDRESFELPSAHNVWAPLENQTPGVVTDRVDVGGLRSMTPAHFGGFGTTWTQNSFEIDAIDATDPASGGVPLIDPDPDAFAAIRVLTGEHGAAEASPGIVVSLVPRKGGGQFHAGADAFYEDRNTQSQALAGRETRAGITSVEHLGRFLQGGVQIGGPLSSGGPAYFATLSTDRLSRYPENESEPESWNLTSGSLALSDEHGDHAFRIFGVLQNAHDSALGAAPLQPTASSLDSQRTAGFVSASGSLVASRSADLEVRAGFTSASIADRFPSGTSQQSAISLFDGSLSGAPPLATDGSRARAQLGVTGRRTADGRVSLFGRDLPLSIDMSVGGDWKETASSDRSRAFDGVNLQYFDGQPNSAVLFDAPMRSRQRTRNVSLFAQAEARAGDHLTINGGIRLALDSGWLPGTSVGSVQWRSVSPRLAAAVPAGRHIVFRAAYARYAHELLDGELETVDPRSPSGRVAVWNDANQDGQFEPGEDGGTLRVFGGQHTSLDPHLRPPVTDALSLSSEWRPSERLGIEISARQRYEKNLLETVNTGVPASSYVPVTVVDPGPDGIPGTGDDRSIVVYDQDPSTLGQDHFLLTNPRGFRALARSGQILLRWQNATNRLKLEASFTAFSIIGEASSNLTSQQYDEGVIGTLFDDPNTLIHADGRLFFDRGYLAKGWALYRLPGDITLGCVAKYSDGTPYARRVVVSGLNQGPIFVFATQRGNKTLAGVVSPENGPRTEYALTVDLGVQKSFAAAGGQLALRVDVFNLLNFHDKTRNVDIGGPTYLDAVETMAPRVARLGLAWTL